MTATKVIRSNQQEFLVAMMLTNKDMFHNLLILNRIKQ